MTVSLNQNNPLFATTATSWAVSPVCSESIDSDVSQYRVEIASSPNDIRLAQQLRYEVFRSEYGASFGAGASGLDQDEFDTFCDHLIVCHQVSGRVVGTYRLLRPAQARRLGRYYSQGEFYMTRIERMIPGLLEIGRSCVHPDHRNGPVIMMLWSGIVRYLLDHGCTHLIGCASVSMRDGGVRAATLWDRFQTTAMVDAMLEVFPKHPLPLDQIARDQDRMVPPLIRAYLRMGAKVCGEPSWDPDFNSADFLMLLDLADLDQRYARHFGLQTT